MKSRRTTTASMHRARKIRASGFASLSCGRRDDAEMPSIRCCSGCSDDGDGGDDDDDDDDDHNGHTHGGEGVDANSDADFWPLSYHNKEMLHFKMIVLMQPKRGALNSLCRLCTRIGWSLFSVPRITWAVWVPGPHAEAFTGLWSPCRILDIFVLQYPALKRVGFLYVPTASQHKGFMSWGNLQVLKGRGIYCSQIGRGSETVAMFGTLCMHSFEGALFLQSRLSKFELRAILDSKAQDP